MKTIDVGWQSYGTTNEPDTCLWCGRKLYQQKSAFDGDGRYLDRKDRTEYTHEKPGGYGDGHFCGLRCAYRFAVVLADAGQRLKPAEEAS